MSKNRLLLLKFPRLLASKDFYNALYANISGSKRDNTIAVFSNVCLLISAILKSFGLLIESNKLAKWQRLLNIIRYNLSLVLGFTKLSSSSLSSLSSADRPGLNITTTIATNYKNKYIVNSAQQVESSRQYEYNKKLADGLYHYAKIFRSEYSYITDVRIFNHILSSISYMPQLIDIIAALPQNIAAFHNKLNSINKQGQSNGAEKSKLVQGALLQVIDKLQVVNCFGLQLFEDLAFVGDHKFSKYLTKHSLTNWYVSSKFWFLYVVLDIAKYAVEQYDPIASSNSAQSTSHIRSAISLAEVLKNNPIVKFGFDNKNNLLNLVLAYHWGFDWQFLNDYQLSMLNLNNYIWTFLENWKELASVVANELK